MIKIHEKYERKPCRPEKILMFGEEGLAGIAAYIRKKGMLPGLWLEMEVAGENSEIYKKGDDWFLTENGVRVGGGARVFLDFRNPRAVRPRRAAKRSPSPWKICTRRACSASRSEQVDMRHKKAQERMNPLLRRFLFIFRLVPPRGGSSLERHAVVGAVFFEFRLRVRARLAHALHPVVHRTLGYPDRRGEILLGNALVLHHLFHLFQNRHDCFLLYGFCDSIIIYARARVNPSENKMYIENNFCIYSKIKHKSAKKGRIKRLFGKKVNVSLIF